MPLLRECKCGTKAYDQEDLELFVKKRNGLHGRQSLCKKCDNIRRKKHYRDNKEQSFMHHCKRKYDITVKEYKEAMKTSTICFICESKENLCYDHDHTTMKFRGVLCNRCNRAIGLLEDNEELVGKAYIYLKRIPNDSNLRHRDR